MNENKYNSIQQWIFIAGTGILFLGLVCSKALISIGSVVVICSGLMGLKWRTTNLSLNYQVIGFGLLFLAPLISGFWSDSKGDWFQVISNKIMLPALFWAVIYTPKLPPKSFYRLSIFQGLTVVFASFYSIWPLWYHGEGISQSYLQAKTLKVLLSNDHLHFSLYILITLVLMIYNSKEIHNLFGKKTHYLHSAMILWLVIFLHILGAKTGLILLYGSAVYFLWRKYAQTTRWLILPAGLGVIILIGITAIKLIPTLQNRVYYTLYDFNQYIHGAYVDGLTDGARVLSWQAGMDIGRRFPWTGVGFGDMHNTFAEWHKAHSAHLQPYNWLQPSNEWLMYLCGSGIGGMMMLTLGLWCIYRYSPLRETTVFNILFFCQFFMLWYEVNLTNQTGIAIFAFFIGWLHHRFNFSSEMKETVSSIPLL